jgi:hypothetical protein
MEGTELAGAILALAKTEAASPEGRVRLVRILCETLMALAGSGVSSQTALSPEIVGGLADASASLIMAADHVEFVAERLAALTT